MAKVENSAVHNPKHYGGADNPYEAIKVIEAWGLGFCLGNTVKYISRAGKKDLAKVVEDLEKARWYLDREISNRKKPNEENVYRVVLPGKLCIRDQNRAGRRQVKAK